MDRLYFDVADAMAKRGFLGAANSLHERWTHYNPYEQETIAKAWGL